MAFAALQHLGKQVLLTNPSNRPLLVGSAYRVDVDLAKKVCDVLLPPEADRLICRLSRKGKPIGAIELQGAGVVAGREIAKAAAEGYAHLLSRKAWTLGQCLRKVKDFLRRWTLRLRPERQ